MYRVTSAIQHPTPEGVDVVLHRDSMTLHVGRDLVLDLRTLLHATEALDAAKWGTDEQGRPVALATRKGAYVGVVQNGAGAWNAMVGVESTGRGHKVILSTHSTAGEAATARAVYLLRKRDHALD